MEGWDAATVKACGCIHTLPHPLPEDVRIGLVQADRRGDGGHRYRRPRTMKRGDYVRMTVYLIPPGLQAPSLSVLVLISDQVSLMEGWLTAPVLVGAKIHLAARIKEGERVQGTYTSEPILAIQGPLRAYPTFDSTTMYLRFRRRGPRTAKVRLSHAPLSKDTGEPISRHPRNTPVPCWSAANSSRLPRSHLP